MILTQSLANPKRVSGECGMQSRRKPVEVDERALLAGYQQARLLRDDAHHHPARGTPATSRSPVKGACLPCLPPSPVSACLEISVLTNPVNTRVMRRHCPAVSARSVSKQPLSACSAAIGRALRRRDQHARDRRHVAATLADHLCRHQFGQAICPK
jgi:hypothetical protein